MNISEKLIMLRKKHGLSQEEFGNEIDVSRQAVSKWESGQTKPETDKIVEIAKKFNVSYEYLLNDEVEEEKPSEEIASKRRINKKVILRVLLAIILLYIVISLYRFISLYRMYKIADSFSEKNYWMNQEYEIHYYNETKKYTLDMEKSGNQMVIKNYDNNKSDEYPIAIEYTDGNTKTYYMLNYDEEKKKYHCYPEKEYINDNLNNNHIKDTTCNIIPSSFLRILLTSINPTCLISNKNKTIRFNHIDGTTEEIYLTDDYLVDEYIYTDKSGARITSISYDYVPDHYDGEIESPLEIYKNMIVENN